MRDCPAPLAELVIVTGLFFGIVSLDAATTIAPRILWHSYSIRGAVRRLVDEANVSVRTRNYIAEEPLPRAGDEWRVETASLIREHEERSQTGEGLQRFYEPIPQEQKFRAQSQTLVALDHPRSGMPDPLASTIPDVRIRLRNNFASSQRP